MDSSVWALFIAQIIWATAATIAIAILYRKVNRLERSKPKDVSETRYKGLLREIRTVARGESSPGYPSIQQRIVEMVDQALGQEIPDKIDDRQG